MPQIATSAMTWVLCNVLRATALVVEDSVTSALEQAQRKKTVFIAAEKGMREMGINVICAKVSVQKLNAAPAAAEPGVGTSALRAMD
jgi:hypothetical protein